MPLFLTSTIARGLEIETLKVAFRLGNLFQRRRHRRVDHHIGSVVRSSALLVQRLIQERTRWQSTNQSASALSQAQPANACRSRRR